MSLKKGVKQLVAEANEAITTVSVKEAIKLVGAPDVLFVDIRDVRELEREGTLPGAFHAPRGMLEFWVDPDSPYYKPIFGEGKRTLFYCASAWRSALATKAVQEMGLPNVGHIEGGFTAWKAAGGPIVAKEAHKPKS